MPKISQLAAGVAATGAELVAVVQGGQTVRLTTEQIATALPAAIIRPKNNLTHSIYFTHPDSTDAAYDTAPLAAIFIARPPTPTTRNFLSGIWVQTDGASVDKGRGIFVHNFGKSDSFCSLQEGELSLGYAAVLQTSATGATGFVAGTTVSGQVGAIFRQETSISPTAGGNPLTVEANGSITEMVRINSTVASQVGIVTRMTGANSLPLRIQNAADATVAAFDNTGFQTLANRITVGSAALGISGSVGFSGSTSGTAILTVAAAAGTPTLTLPTLTTTLAGLALTQTWTGVNTFASTTTGSVAAFQSTANGSIDFTVSSVPATGAANDSANLIATLTKDDGVSYVGARMRINQDTATAGAMDASFNWFTVRSGGANTQRMFLGAGLSVGSTTDPGVGIINALTEYRVGNTKVVGARDTGWTAMTGTPDESTSYATGSVTLPQLAGRVMALQTALTTHGLIGA